MPVARMGSHRPGRAPNASRDMTCGQALGLLGDEHELRPDGRSGGGTSTLGMAGSHKFESLPQDGRGPRHRAFMGGFALFGGRPRTRLRPGCLCFAGRGHGGAGGPGPTTCLAAWTPALQPAPVSGCPTSHTFFSTPHSSRSKRPAPTGHYPFGTYPGIAVCSSTERGAAPHMAIRRKLLERPPRLSANNMDPVVGRSLRAVPEEENLTSHATGRASGFEVGGRDVRPSRTRRAMAFRITVSYFDREKRRGVRR
jgi:hypothetical protein